MWLFPWLPVPNTNRDNDGDRKGLEDHHLARFLPRLKVLRLATSPTRSLPRFDNAWRIIGHDVVVWGTGVCVESFEKLTALARSRLGENELHCIANIDKNAPESRMSTRIVFLVGEDFCLTNSPNLAWIPW